MLTAQTIAHLYGMEREDTLVAQALATSLAPLLYTSSRAKKVPMAKMYENWSSAAGILEELHQVLAVCGCEVGNVIYGKQGSCRMMPSL